MQIFSAHKSLFILLMVFCFVQAKGQTIDSAYIDKKIDSVYVRQNDSYFVTSRLAEADSLSKKIGYKAGEVAVMQLNAYLFYVNGSLDSAKKYFEISHQMLPSIKNKNVIAQNYRLYAIYFEGIDKIEKAFELLFKSLAIRKSIGDKKGEAGCYVSIGICFLRIGQVEKCIYYQQLALKYFESVNNESAISSIYSNLGSNYNNLGKIDSAIFYLKKVIAIKKKSNDLVGLGKAYHNIGTSYTYNGNYGKALSFYKKAIATNGGGEENYNNANDYDMIGYIHTFLGNYDEAERNYLIAEKLMLKGQMMVNLFEVYGNLKSLAELRKDYAKANKYRAMETNIQDSLERSRNLLLASEYEAKYQSIEKQRENDLLQAENKLLESEAKNNNLLIVSLVVVVVISLVLGYNLRLVRVSKNKLLYQNEIIASQNVEMANKNEDLEHLIEENQALMGILAHDLRSPFTKISGLVNLLEQEEEQSEREIYIKYTKDICKDSLQLIQDTIDVSEIFNNKNVDKERKNEEFYPSEILLNLSNSFNAVAKDKNIELVVNNTLENLKICNAKEYLNRVFDNLLSNAIKFSPANSKVVFSANQVNNKVVFSIKDSGPGFTDEDKKQLFMRFKKLSARPTGNEASSGLGLFIVKQLVSAMGGDIQVISEYGKGTEFIVELPIKA